jgi:hypothetical protein
VNLLPYIADLLFRHKSCELPGIGRFSMVYFPSRPDAGLELVQPPYERIVFEESTEGSIVPLVRYLSLREHITEPKANAELEKAILRIKLSLAEGFRVEIPEIGSLSRNADGKTEFSPQQHDLQSWEPVEAHPIPKKSTTALTAAEPLPVTDPFYPVLMPGTEQASVSGRWWWLIALVVFGLLIVMVLCLRQCAVSPQTTITSVTPLPIHAVPISPSRDSISRQALTLETKKRTPMAEADSIHFNIVFASFPDRLLARKKYLKIRHWGHPVALLKQQDGSFLLAVPCYTNTKDTSEKLSEVRRNYGKTAYILY